MSQINLNDAKVVLLGSVENPQVPVSLADHVYVKETGSTLAAKLQAIDLAIENANGGTTSALDEAKQFATDAVSTHNVATDAHNDIRLELSELSTKVSNFLDVDDETRDQLSELLQLIDCCLMKTSF